MQKKWLIKTQPSEEDITKLADALKVSRIVAHMLIQRKISTYQEAESFFNPNLDSLHDPFLMLNMDKAVSRLNKAIEKDEKIMIFGDYDVDGTTAVALVFSFLSKHHTNIEYYIPDRYKEGYGLSLAGIDFAIENNISLIITLDCGVKAVDKVAYGKEKGIDFIICDHHNPGDILPEAVVLDQKQKDCDYPYKELCGCGVGFKFMQAMCSTNKWDTHPLFEEMDLLAIAIGADIVSITGENRAMAMNGLFKLNANPRPGIKRMLELANRKIPLTLTDVVFSIAPRINAAGRMGDAKNAVRLMLARNEKEIEDVATLIQEENDKRREIDANITVEALQNLEATEGFEERKSTVVYKEDWHKGVIGIVASRLIEKYYKPTIVLTKSGEYASGSVRSVQGFNVYNALEQCADTMIQFGGHKYAAGLTIEIDKIDALKEKFEEVVAASIKDEQLIPEEIVEMELSFDEIFTKGEPFNKIPRLKRILTRFEPHGPENMKPVFVSRNVFAKPGARLLKELHLKAEFTQPNTNISIPVIGFNMPEAIQIINSGKPFDIAYTLEVNVWQKKSTLQLNIKGIRPVV